MRLSPSLWWWMSFFLWIGAAIAAIVHPLLTITNHELKFACISNSIYAAGVSGLVFVFTISNWRKLAIFQRCLGLLPLIYPVGLGIITLLDMFRAKR